MWTSLDLDPFEGHITGRCSECGEFCVSVTVDFGVGYTEAWGRGHTDVDLCEVSPCCEAEVIPTN